MRVSDVYRTPSEKVKAEDLKGRDVTLTIRDVEEVKFDDGKKLVVHFYKTDKSLVLNRTNADHLSEMLGDEADFWIGQHITLFPDKTMFAGKYVDCIRIRHSTQQQSHLNAPTNYQAPSPPQQHTNGSGNGHAPAQHQEPVYDNIDDVPF